MNSFPLLSVLNSNGVSNQTSKGMSTDISIGNEIKDSYKETHKWVQNNIKWLSELESFYRDRAKLEKEYSDKLSQMVGEYFSKKSGNTVALSVGDTPTITPGSLEAASLVAWNEILSQTEMISKDHNKLANEYEFQIADQMLALNKKCEMILTTIGGFNDELTSKRDQSYHSLEKAKKRYDESCSNMEAARQRQSRSSGDKAQRKVAEKESEMNICKNDYLIKINQANRIKDKYYFQDVPEVLDLLQDLNESRTHILNQLWIKADSLERELNERVNSRLDTADSVIVQNKPHLDVSMFIKHNAKAWKEPTDFTYIPSSVWHEDEQFVVPSNVELQELRIRLAKAQQTYDNLSSITQTELSELSRLNKQKQQLKSGEQSDAAMFQELLKKYLKTVSPFTAHETSKLEAEVEIESIQNNVGQDHDLSTDDIDLSKLKKKGGLLSKFKHSLTISSGSSGTGVNGSSGYIPDAASTVSSESKHHNRLSIFKRRDRTQSNASSTVQSNVSEDSFSVNSSIESSVNRVLYPYAKQDADEVTINPGDLISLVTKDTGSGWTKIKNNTTGEMGLVPSSYVDIKESTHSVPHAPPPRKCVSSVRTIEALYDYQAQGDDELSIYAGSVVKVLKPDDGSGWTYGELDGAKGLFPTSYCK